MFRDRFPGEQRDDVRHDRCRQPVLPRPDFDDPIPVAQAQAEDVLNLRIERHGSDDLRRPLGGAKSALRSKRTPSDRADQHLLRRHILEAGQVLATNTAGTSVTGATRRPANACKATSAIEHSDVAMNIAGSASKPTDARNRASRVAFPLTNWAVTTPAT